MWAGRVMVYGQPSHPAGFRGAVSGRNSRFRTNNVNLVSSGRADMNYNINLQMHVASHVTVVKSSLYDVFARARAPIHGAIHGKTYHMLYLPIYDPTAHV